MPKILILEDEPGALQRLSRMIKEIRPQYRIVNTADNVEDAIQILKEEQFDLLLSDVELSDGTCFEVFESVNPEKPIIFITAYNDYAIKAFKYNGIYYLLKPITYEDLTQAFVKFEKNSISVDAVTKLQGSDLMPADYKKRFISKVGNKFKVVETKTIVLFYTENGIVYAKTSDDKNFSLDDTLENISRQIDPDVFFRINRQMIVNINTVEDMYAYSSNRLKLKLSVVHNDDVIVSKDKTSDFKSWIASH